MLKMPLKGCGKLGWMVKELSYIVLALLSDKDFNDYFSQLYFLYIALVGMDKIEKQMSIKKIIKQ